MSLLLLPFHFFSFSYPPIAYLYVSVLEACSKVVRVEGIELHVAHILVLSLEGQFRNAVRLAKILNTKCVSEQ
jgi:hypothetical protein